MATDSDTITDGTDDWPAFTDYETVVEHLNSLRSRITVDIATRLCDKCPINYFYNRHILRNRIFMKSYLLLLLDILSLVPRFTFLQMFPKGCGGCTIFQLYAIVFLHPSLVDEVHNLLKALLCDDEERILPMIPEMHDMARMIRKDYKRRESPFPYNAVCLDLGRKNQEAKIAGALGAMIASEKFLHLMKTHDEKAIKIAQEMIKDDKEYFDFGSPLNSLLETI
ncbi:unnamed protein product [Adineta steineri]|uniref:Uncharacterized protein n=1 Tax=Adineta steineri TaxID=433720 RepID=A0A819Q8B1_9BILA|nr:unnamed protein product [Adineta steineri]CAF4024612.1 unnamed protein product [Adineta steineri]